MKLTKKELKKMAEERQNKLFKAVVDDLLETPAADLENHIKDIIKNGCINGVVSSLIYYHDTLTFYDNYKKEINDLLCIEGLEVKDLQGYYPEDPLCMETTNKNLLAWFGYEETVYQIACWYEIY